MRANAQADIAAVLAARGFSDAGTVVDIGGGSGHLLPLLSSGQIIRAFSPSFQAWLRRCARANPVRDRGRDFFRDPLPLGETYLLMNVLHDWGDAQA